MDDDSIGKMTVWLTRAEAARYVGASGESSIRAAESKGLEAVRDADGQSWHNPRTLDEWPWRCKRPSSAQRERVLRDAHRSRRQEWRQRQRRAEAEELAEWEAQAKRDEHEQALRAAVRQKAKEMRAKFEDEHLDERTAGRALGFDSLRATGLVRDLVNRGLLRRVESPREPRVEVSGDGTAREVESQWPLVRGGPFYRRAEVFELRAEASAVGAEKISEAPPKIQAAARSATDDEIVSALLQLLIRLMR